MTEASRSTGTSMGYREWFSHRYSEEQRRHSSLAEVYDPASIRVLASLDIKPQWRCLDAGCGGGTIASWLARQAHQGQTVACDLDLTLFAAEPSPLLHPIACDIGVADFAPESYDLIHARLLLQHLANREQVLDRMVSWLAPGGWLVVADAFDLAATSTAHPRYAAFHEALYQTLDAQTSTRPSWGRGYPEPLVRRGLIDIGVDVITEPVRGGEPYAQLLHESLGRLRPLLRTQGADESELDAVLAQLRDPGFWDLGYALVIAKGRKPA
ncbi:class I SAM-dependent methyltransferase [Amycolatopsis speibonae]|uniref:Class I SAM-dependent methyltransferase n=1 Tax=Amycolatopsis speibonae TaxID=1450224 RepID=A0ABV7PC47_9PSEU